MYFFRVCSSRDLCRSDHSVSVVTVIKAIVLDVPRIQILRTIRFWTRKCHQRDVVMVKMFWVPLCFKLEVSVYNLLPVAAGYCYFLLLTVLMAVTLRVTTEAQ